MANLQELHITLTEEQSEAMQAAIDSGEYTSPEQIVQVTLEDWKWQREWLKPEHVPRLRELWEEGKASGDARPLDLDEFFAEAEQRIKTEANKAA